uniref:BTB domain-containing protein n=1 Tax=Panagrellus redivivus TaxID=6233 RepID=A0A7E4V375_PANRE
MALFILAGKATVWSEIEVDIDVPFIPFVLSIFHLLQHVPTDTSLVVESKTIPTHKHFLLLISPVFKSMFLHDTAKVEITDFDFKTVKSVIDYCYGRELKDLSIDTIVSMLRFSDKYTIMAITDEFEKLPSANLSVETFCTIVRYAYDCNKKTLFTKCCDFFKEHQDELKTTDKFAKLPPALVTTVLKSVFILKTNFDILRHAHKKNINSVVEHLEQSFLKQMTLQDFCLGRLAR